MDKIERAREMFRALEGGEDCAVDVARREFWIRDRIG